MAAGIGTGFLLLNRERAAGKALAESLQQQLAAEQARAAEQLATEQARAAEQLATEQAGAGVAVKRERENCQELREEG